MIKKYLEFIKESEVNGFNTLGEWVESLISDDYIKNIVGRYTNNEDHTIRLSNAINILDDRIKEEIKDQIEKYLEVGIEDKAVVTTASTDVEELMESEITKAGRGIFNSFLKTLTALGQKDKTSNLEKCPNNFLLFYYYDNLNAEMVKQIISRFKSLTPYLEHIDYGKNEVDLYFGVKVDGELEYGVSYDDKLTHFGSFKLTQSVIKWLNNLESKSAFSLKKELVNLSYKDIITLGRIKNDMATYLPGYHEKKMNPSLKDRILSFGYQGIGKWDNGKLDEGELINIKSNFVNWLVSRNWGDKVLISVKPSSYWLYINIKLK